MVLPEGGLPVDKLPPCWSDDVRMNALFAPFRLKASNPESWAMKMKFWSDMLRQWCRFKGDPIFCAADAKVAFHRNGRTPTCIDIVIEEMFRSGELSPITKYQQVLHTGPEGWVRWGARLAFKPAALALTAVSSLLPGRQAVDHDGLPKATIDSTQRFIMEDVLKDQATSLLNRFPLGVERVGSIDELMKRCQWKNGREAFEIAIGWLVANNMAVVKGSVVKLAEPDKKASEVTETDEALVRLVSAENRLEGDATRFNREVSAAEADARASLALGNRAAAKAHLRRKHKAEQRLKRCEAALENVQQLLNTMRDVDSNKVIVDTYRATSEAMKKGMKNTGLEEEAVHDTMDDLREVMEAYNEVEKALAGNIDDTDAAELEAELKELLASSGPGGGTPGTDKKDKNIPSTPSKTPRKTSEREFVFDGEERIIAELNELGVEETSPRPVPKKVPLEDNWQPQEKTPERAKGDQAWYPPSTEFLQPDVWNNNYELRQDERLHPGQPLNIDFSSPARLYQGEFQVQDHKLESKVWLYNPGPDHAATRDTLATSTEYFSSESPGKSGGNFQMAPGGERKKSTVTWPKDEEDNTVEDLERRLKNLRNVNL